ncbi:MAG: ABC transporter permease [Gemmatimonadaceae bacterium]
MSSFDGFRRLFRLVSRTPREIARDVDEELDTHVELRVSQFRSNGLSDADARTEAARRFGDMNQTRGVLTLRAQRRAKRVRLNELFDSIVYDAFFAVRQLRRAPSASLFAVTSLALGIALATSFFAVIDGVMLRPLPFRDPGRLVALQSVDSARNSVVVVSADNWYDWKNSNKTFSDMALYGISSRAPIMGDEGAVRASTVQVTPGFFDVVGMTMLRGRGLEAEDATTTANVAVISEGLWRRQLGSHELPLTLRFYGVKFQIVGVLARGQELPADAELWTVYSHHQVGGAMRNNINWFGVGRLAPGVTIEQATADLTRIALGIHATEKAALYSYGVSVLPLREVLVGKTSRYLVLLMGAVLFVLLIACANLASINVARGTSRAREMAVRAAIGAGRGRLIRQLLVEHMFVAILGGIIGTALAFALTRMLVAWASEELPRAGEISIDGGVLLFTLVTTILVGLLTGLLPSLQAGRASLVATMTAVSRGAVGGGARTGRALVIMEIASAVVLVAGAGLLIQSFRTLLAQPLGYETRGILTAEIALSGAKYGGRAAPMGVFWQTLLRQLRASPQVADAGLANWIPLGIDPRSFIMVEGRNERMGGGYRVVSDGYFNALRIPVLQGRAFTNDDNLSQPRVGVVNQAMAKAFWPGESPIGKRLSAGSMEAFSGKPADWITVVGEVGDVRHSGPEGETEPELYVAYQQLPFRMSALTLVVRAKNADLDLAPFVRQQLKELDPLLAADVGSLAQKFDSATAERRFIMSLLLLFGVLALALAAIGVYSVLAFQVAQRTRELAVRTALGADRAQLLRLVLQSGAQLIAFGVVIGIVGALVLSRVMTSLVFGVSTHDPFVFGTAAAVIALVGLAAAFIPALRATRIEPMMALQSE